MIDLQNPHDADLALPADDSLIPAVVQDSATGRVLMLAYMNREALELTRSTERVTFYSRSRQTLWEKGETSGNALHAESVTLDCDGDALLVKARPDGPACHTGTDTCWDEANESADFLAELERIVESRAAADDDESYTVRLLRAGAKKIAQKVGEEGVEVALEAASGDDERLLEESADLLYHLIVLLRSRGKSLQDVQDILRGRHAG